MIVRLGLESWLLPWLLFFCALAENAYVRDKSITDRKGPQGGTEGGGRNSLTRLQFLPMHHPTIKDGGGESMFSGKKS